MANRLKYRNAEAFSEKIGAYFDSISAEETVMRTEFHGTDADGKKIFKVLPVLKRNGEEMRKTAWYTPPTIGGLCLHLGISRKTLGEYALRGGKYAAAVENARSIVCAYLEEKISDPDIHNVKGVQLALESLLSTLEEERRATQRKLTTADYAALLAEARASGFIPEETDGEDGADADEE